MHGQPSYMYMYIKRKTSALDTHDKLKYIFRKEKCSKQKKSIEIIVGNAQCWAYNMFVPFP